MDMAHDLLAWPPSLVAVIRPAYWPLDHSARAVPLGSQSYAAYQQANAGRNQLAGADAGSFMATRMTFPAHQPGVEAGDAEESFTHNSSAQARALVPRRARCRCTRPCGDCRRRIG
jgi:hypothetical protein